jgi:hypothetical protein
MDQISLPPHNRLVFHTQYSFNIAVMLYTILLKFSQLTNTSLNIVVYHATEQ